MAKEIQMQGPASGDAIYAIVRNSVAQPYNVSIPGFEDYTTSQLSNYAILLTEQGIASAYYSGDMPPVSGGVYTLAFYRRVGVDPSETDIGLGTALIEWAGSEVADLATLEAMITAVSSQLPPSLVGGRIDAHVGDISGTAENALADAILDRAAGVEVGFTVRQGLRLILAAMAGKLAGAGTISVAIRAANDLKTRITATVDAQGNRTVMVLDPS